LLTASAPEEASAEPISCGLVAGVEAVAFFAAPEHVLAAAARASAHMPVVVLGHDDLRSAIGSQGRDGVAQVAACSESGAKATAIASAEAATCIFLMCVAFPWLNNDRLASALDVLNVSAARRAGA